MEPYAQQFTVFHCPRWNELPDLELYMDQVVSYIDSHLSAFDLEEEGKSITSTMINNYVKQHLVAAPKKKRYTRQQLAKLMVITVLKRAFSITEIDQMTQLVKSRYDIPQAYDYFCAELERALAAAFGAPQHASPAPDDSEEYAALLAVMRAFANKVYVQALLKAISAAQQ